MGYVLKQYNYRTGSDDGTDFMIPIQNGEPSRQTIVYNMNVYSSVDLNFKDECLYIEGGFSSNNTYYFHGKIKKLTTSQIFNIKLYNDSEGVTDIEGYKEQYIKTIQVEKSNNEYDEGTNITYNYVQSDWVDVEFIFTPQVTFQYLAFELQRTVEDDIVSKDGNLSLRYPIIAYEELSIVNNILNKKLNMTENLIKIGIQSRPGLLMCINKEEIRTSRTGIYEFKNGVMTINFFSVCRALEEESYDIDVNKTNVNDMNMATWMRYINIQLYNIEKALYNGSIDSRTAGARKAELLSRCFFNSNKYRKATRKIDNFSLDYLYKEVTEI